MKYRIARNGFVKRFGRTIIEMTPARFAASVSVSIWSPASAEVSGLKPDTSIACNKLLGDGLYDSIMNPAPIEME